MFKKGTKLYSIFRYKCPVCQEGDFFEGPSYKGEVKHHCDVCDHKNYKEPAFYQGSYYVAYALGIATITTTIIAALILLPEPNPAWIFGITIAVNLGLAPVIYPLSKIIWANFFFSYKKPEELVSK